MRVYWFRMRKIWMSWRSGMGSIQLRRIRSKLWQGQSSNCGRRDTRRALGKRIVLEICVQILGWTIDILITQRCAMILWRLVNFMHCCRRGLLLVRLLFVVALVLLLGSRRRQRWRSHIARRMVVHFRHFLLLRRHGQFLLSPPSAHGKSDHNGTCCKTSHYAAYNCSC